MNGVKNRELFCAAEEICVCVCVTKRDNTEYTGNSKTVLTRSKNRKMSQHLQQEGEGAYVVIFSVLSLTSTDSWERGGILTSY